MKQFWNHCQPYVEQRAAKWGFLAHSRGIFVRKREGFWNGFAIMPSRNQPHSCYVEVGVHVPALHDYERYIARRDYPGFEISHRLGEGVPARGASGTYGFRNEAQLTEALNRMFGHFEAWALPWCERFQSLDDVAKEFFRLRVECLPQNHPVGTGAKLPDPMGWALYGWMLLQLGNRDESTCWLRKAYDEVRRPLFIDESGRFVPQGTKRAKAVRHSEAEERLEELLRQSLGYAVSA